MRYLRRHIEQQLLQAAKYFKAIFVLGARQAGKSTLLSHLFPEMKNFVFDPIQDRPKFPPTFFPLTEFLFRGTFPGTVDVPTVL